MNINFSNNHNRGKHEHDKKGLSSIRLNFMRKKPDIMGILVHQTCHSIWYIFNGQLWLKSTKQQKGLNYFNWEYKPIMKIIMPYFWIQRKRKEEHRHSRICNFPMPFICLYPNLMWKKNVQSIQIVINLLKQTMLLIVCIIVFMFNLSVSKTKPIYNAFFIFPI